VLNTNILIVYNLRKPKFDSLIKKHNLNYSSDISKRKKLINLRENQSQSKAIAIDKVSPSKLLIELASLSSFNFQIEMKSKYQTLFFPLSEKTLNDVKVTNNKMLENEDENILKVSSLETDYIILKCSIINEKLVLVPPIRIFVPYNYPKNNPFVDLNQIDEFDDEMLPEYSIKVIL
jgi:hypothetical protein